jgi:hypothetical protein
MKVRQRNIVFMNNILGLESHREWPSGYEQLFFSHRVILLSTPSLPVLVGSPFSFGKTIV